MGDHSHKGAWCQAAGTQQPEEKFNYHHRLCFTADGKADGSYVSSLNHNLQKEAGVGTRWGNAETFNGFNGKEKRRRRDREREKKGREGKEKGRKGKVRSGWKEGRKRGRGKGRGGRKKERKGGGSEERAREGKKNRGIKGERKREGERTRHPIFVHMKELP